MTPGRLGGGGAAWVGNSASLVTDADTNAAIYFIAVYAWLTWAGGGFDAWALMKAIVITLRWCQLSALEKYEFKT